jgi:hypothetical protein
MEKVAATEDHTNHPAPEKATDFQASIDVVTACIAALQTDIFSF